MNPPAGIVRGAPRNGCPYREGPCRRCIEAKARSKTRLERVFRAAALSDTQLIALTFPRQTATSGRSVSVNVKYLRMLSESRVSGRIILEDLFERTTVGQTRQDVLNVTRVPFRRFRHHKSLHPVLRLCKIHDRRAQIARSWISPRTRAQTAEEHLEKKQPFHASPHPPNGDRGRSAASIV